MWPAIRPGDPLGELSRQCCGWERSLAASEAAIQDFQREVSAKAAALAAFQAALAQIESDQAAFDRLISHFEQTAEPSPPAEGDPLDDAKELSGFLDHHDAEMARVQSNPLTEWETLAAIAYLQEKLDELR
jgi:hypothetical protein